ncbi:MAG: O-antigen ligase family protein [Anaerolineales bacterium]|nr:O-antigen ligase family protein [Anaerolineales bacterium]
MQLPFLYAQSRGWTDWLPTELKMFTSSVWGGSASSVAVLRYGGMFGDYELLAEYLDMVALFCVGICMITSSSKERFFAFLSLGLILLAGFYTGSRTFIAGLGLGVLVVIFLMIIRQGFSKKLMSILVIVSILVLAIIYLSTQEIFSGYIARFQNSQIGLNNFDTRNTVWEKSFSLMKNLPFTGYGAWMKDIFISTPGGNYDSPHSAYFWMFLTAGYPGLFAILIIVITPFVWTFRVLSSKSAAPYHMWAIVLISVWVFWMANEVIVEFTRYPFYMDIIFFLLGITASFYDLAFNKAINGNEKSVLGS